MSNAVIRCFQIAHVKSLFSVFHAPVQNMFCHEQRCETMFSDYTCCEDLVYFGGTCGCAEYVV